MTIVDYKSLEHLSPFEIKDKLIQLAKTEGRRSARVLLNAGRGNPNWIASRAREAFFLLGQFAIAEARSVFDHPAGLAGMPPAKGVKQRFDGWIKQQDQAPGAAALREMVDFAISRFSFDPDVV